MEFEKVAETGMQSLQGASANRTDEHQPARNFLIEELVLTELASLRLKNAIARGINYDVLPCRTIGEYLDLGSLAQQLFIRSLSNFGRKSAQELDALVHDYLQRVSYEQSTPSQAEVTKPVRIYDHEERTTEPVARLGTMTLYDALEGQNASTRLTNALTQNDLGQRKVSELYDDSRPFQEELLKLQNFGRNSLSELKALCRNSVIRELAKVYESPEEIAKECAVFLRTSSEGPAEKELINQVLETLQNLPPSSCGLKDLIEWALAKLSARERDIVVRRYGLDKRTGETLEQIGECYCVTRERIRQLEAKSIRWLRQKFKGTSLTLIVNEASARFWAERSDPFLVVAPDDIDDLKRELLPEVMLALDILRIPIRAWLEKTSTPMANGYLNHSIDAAVVRQIADSLARRLAGQPLPISLSEAIHEDDPKAFLVEAAVRLETTFVLFESYILPVRPRARLKRTIRLHALLYAEKRVCKIHELGDLYLRRFQADRCSLRDLVIVMEFSPQLFLEIEEGVWAVLGKGGKLVAAVPPEAKTASQTEIDHSTIAGSVQEALSERGPTALGDLFRDAECILPEGRSRNSIGPILLGRPDLFHRVLPGVFALADQIPSLETMLSEPLPYLLTEAQGRTYVYGRLAGEPWGAFALWTPVTEYRLCKWAKFEGSPALFRSLLATAEVEMWPIGPVQKDEWLRLAELYGRFELPAPEQAIVREQRPELDRLLAAALIASERGSIGWVQANRILGRRLDAAVGQNLLALLIALDIVDPPEGSENDVRLRPHLLAKAASDLVEKLTTELSRLGRLQWDSPSGRALAEQAMTSSPTQLGWVRFEDLMRVLQSDLGKMPSLKRTEDVIEQESDEELMSRLIGEHRRTVDQDRREKATQWLLED